jgi:hypothetical protein
MKLADATSPRKPENFHKIQSLKCNLRMTCLSAQGTQTSKG